MVFRVAKYTLAELVIGPGLERGSFGTQHVDRLRRSLPGYVTSHLQLERGGEACRLVSAGRRADFDGKEFALELRAHCPRVGD